MDVVYLSIAVHLLAKLYISLLLGLITRLFLQLQRICDVNICLFVIVSVLAYFKRYSGS